jgi:tRNA pseudouridine65 synthase
MVWESLDVLYQDEALVAVHKPSGLLVHRTQLDRHAEQWALQIVRRQLGGAHLYPVHRLDRGTSGILIFARHRIAHAELTRAFALREVRKTYLAIVRGWPDESGEINEPLKRIIEAGDDPAHEGSEQTARTVYRRLACAELPICVDRYPTTRYALVVLEPLTGRRHQLRRHMRKLDHPLIGDTTYGSGRHNRLFRERFGSHRLLLAATRLQLLSPATGLRVDLKAPLSADFADVIQALGWATVDLAALPELKPEPEPVLTATPLPIHP